MGVSRLSTFTFCAVATLFLLSGKSGKNDGVIEGVLVDEHGEPVAEASIIAYPVDRGFTHTPGSGTDSKGAFSIKGLHWGKYAVAAKKESANYASTYDSFDSGDTLPPVVEVSPSHPRVKVKLQFVGKAGVLVLSVNDPQNKVLFACTELARASDPSRWLRTFVNDRNSRFLVPADTDVRIRVWLAGYLPWPYPKGATSPASDVIRLGPSEQKTLNVTLVPDPASPYRSEDDRLMEVKRMAESGCGSGP